MQDHAAETRAKYHAQHTRVANDDDAMERFIGMFPESYFGLPAGFFSEARALDAGCGSTGKLLIALYRLGCRDVHGFDIGTDFEATTKGSLKKYGVPHEQVTLKSGSVLDIPYGDGEFDFTACHGVLVHLNDKGEAERAMKELARVTKPGGYLYTVFGCVGGLFEEVVFPKAREAYQENESFKRFIDTISPEFFHRLIDKMVAGLKKNEGEEVPPEYVAFAKRLIDVDFAVLFQNVIQAPVRLQITAEEIRRWYKQSGFDEPRSLVRYVKRKNIRKYTAQLHIERDDPDSRFLYGSGNLEFIAQKN
jgi:SAM-dependent methyltransferase